eukprot:8802220-Pyramimonas_sp.AAC.1
MKRVCFDVVRSLLSPKSKKLLPRFKAILQTLVVQGWWTEEKLAQLGYDVPNECPLCKAFGDTIHHRLFSCQHPE